MADEGDATKETTKSKGISAPRSPRARDARLAAALRANLRRRRIQRRDRQGTGHGEDSQEC